MATYIAMLRGINVGGHRLIKMEQLCGSFTALGCREVRCYVQSGNVVFESRAGAPCVLSKRIEAKILRDYGFDAPVLVRTAAELACVQGENPFPKEAGVDPSRLHVAFLAAIAPAGACELLQGLAAKSERFFVNGREVYLHCPDGYGGTKLSNTAIEAKLGVTATTRNWKTVNALLAMTSEAG